MKAISIGLLLPESINKQVIELQNNMTDTVTKEFPDYPFGRIPHISLCIAYMTDQEIKSLVTMLKNRVHDLLYLTITNEKLSCGNLNHIQNTRTTELAELHVKICEACVLYHGRAGNTRTFCEDVDKKTQGRVTNFMGNSAYGKFDPHITLGPGQICGEIVYETYAPIALGICHLGKYCTVGKVLESFSFGKEI